jgi:hypothetical protein
MDKSFLMTFHASKTSDSNVLFHLVGMFLIAVPFIFAYMFEHLAGVLPQGYKGIRNEQLKDEDRRIFDVQQYSKYKLLEVAEMDYGVAHDLPLL